MVGVGLRSSSDTEELALAVNFVEGLLSEQEVEGECAKEEEGAEKESVAL